MALATLTERKSSIHVQQRGAGFATSSLLLDRFFPQEQLGGQRVPLVAANSNVRKMENDFAKVLGQGCVFENRTNYRICLDFASKRYAAADIGAFSLGLAKFQTHGNFSDWAGFFLSAMINASKDKDFFLDVSHLDVPINYIGASNTKNVTVHGDVGDFAGIAMRSGALTIHGNVGSFLGRYMRQWFYSNGKLPVLGNVLSALLGVASFRQPGVIEVFGDVRYISPDIILGTIKVNGNIEDVDELGPFSHSLPGRCNIFQYGRQLVKHGKIIAHPMNK